MKKLTYSLYINLGLSILFSFLCISFHKDISLLAFPLALIFTIFTSYISIAVLIKKGKISKLGTIRRIFQYEPFVFMTAFVIQRAGKTGMPYIIDLLSVILWVLLLILSFYLLYLLNEKRVYSINEGWKAEHEAAPSIVYKGIKRVGIELFEWVDAIVQAVFTIVLLNIFIFQLYAIPSESMVPTFLIKDRVAVVKTLAGPVFPLSQISLPYLQKYNRGDIVVFRNPHYKDDRESEVKTFLSQVVFMLTLSFVNINTDENGELKADPLVKRVIGLPGEQLMLMDGSLYVRTKDSPVFTKVEEETRWSAWSLPAHKELYDIANNKLKIVKLPISEISSDLIKNIGSNKSHWQYTLSEAIEIESSLYDDVLEIEEARRNLDLVSAALECYSLSAKFNELSQSAHISEDEVPSLFNSSDLYIYNLFKNINETTDLLMSSPGGEQWFNHFMNDWHKNLSDIDTYSEKGSPSGSHLIGGNLYDDSCFRLNVMAKLVFGRIVVRNAEMYLQHSNTTEMQNDEVRTENLRKAQKLFDYVIRPAQYASIPRGFRGWKALIYSRKLLFYDGGQ